MPNVKILGFQIIETMKSAYHARLELCSVCSRILAFIAFFILYTILHSNKILEEKKLLKKLNYGRAKMVKKVT